MPLRNGKWWSLLLILCLLPLGAHGAEFTCNDGAGGTVACTLQRGEELTRASCTRSGMFEIKWVCSEFPELQTVLCRSQAYGQRTISPDEYQDSRFLCSSLCFCP